MADRPIPRLLPLVAAVVGVAWLVPWVVPRYAAEPWIQPAGFEALARLEALAGPDDVVVSNVLTAGTIESFTGLENPLEARQPLIEEPELLIAANDLLVAGHLFFVDPVDRAWVDELGARWFLVADDPAILGATATIGGSTAALSDVTWLHPAWQAEGIAIYEVDSPVVAAAHVDQTQPRAQAVPTGLAALGFGVLAFLLICAPGVPLPRWRASGR